MRRAHWSNLASGRVNAFVPALVAAAGLAVVLAGRPWIGAGVAVGAVLAFINGLLLSRRVDIAADTGDMGRALLIMQMGLFITFTIVGIATVIIVRFSVPMAVAEAAGFAVTQLAMLATFYLTRARNAPLTIEEREA